MIRTLRLFLYFFRWQRVMLWVSLCGVGMMLLAVLVRPDFTMPVVTAGAGVAFGFPLSFAGIAFRQLISNRRFALVPQLRTFAAAALLLLTLLGGAVVFVVMLTANADPGSARALEPATAAILAFSLISGYVLISQWLATHPLGLIGFVLLPLVVLRVSLDGELPAFAPAMSAIAASAGWVWLFVAMRGPALHRPLAAPRWGIAMASGPEHPHYWHPDFGTAASAPGTMLRGFRDGLQGRLSGALLALLIFPVSLVLVTWLMGVPVDSPAGNFATAFFLMWSLFGVAAHSAMLFREWPARLRSLWLRRAGDRLELWRFMDRALRRDLAVVGCGASLIALAFIATTDTDPLYLVAYVAGCVVVTALASYFGFLSRALGWHAVADVMLTVALVLVCLYGVAVLRSDAALERLYWLLPILLAAAVLVRALARRALVRIDWCAIRPARAAAAARSSTAT